MNSMSNRLREFKDKLQTTVTAQQGRSDQYSRAIQAVTRAFITDFDDLFPETLFVDDREHWETLVAKHCLPGPGCPICGQVMLIRKTNYGNKYFQGCSIFPGCRGSRSPYGKPTLNDAMRLYLTECMKEQEDVEDDRFARIATDG